MPPEIKELVQLIGAPAVMVLLLMLRDWFNGRSTAKQDDAITNFSVEFNAERKVAQERLLEQEQKNNHLYAELSDLKSKYAYEAGRRDEMTAEMERKQNEWNTKSNAFDATIREMQTSILDLQKNQRDNQAKIRELEAQIVTLNQRIADKDGEISTLKATVTQLETEKAQLLDLNTELRKQVDERNARIDNLSLLNQRAQEASIPTDNTQAIPHMSVDDTEHPLPIPASGSEPDTNEPPLSSAA